MPINRYLLKKEKAFENAMYRLLRQSQKKVANFLIKQDTQKDFNSDLFIILAEIASLTALLIATRVRPVLIK